MLFPRYILVLALALAACGRALAEPQDASHDAGAAETQPAKVEQRLLSTQEQLVKGLRDAGVQKFPLEKLAALLDSRPKIDTKQFNELIDLASQTMPGALTEQQKQKVKQLFADQLGKAKGNPGTEFAAAARLLGSALPATPQTPADQGSGAVNPQGTIDQLAGATQLATPGTAPSTEQLVASLVDKATKAQQAQMQQQLLQAQSMLQQLQSQQANGGGPNGKAAKGGLSEQLAALLAKQSKGEGGERGGGRDRERPDFGRGRDNDHGSQPQQNQSDDDKDSKKTADLPKAENRGDDRRQQPQIINQQPQQSSSSGTDSNNNKGNGDNKGQAIIQTGEVSKKIREERENQKDKDKDKKNDLSSLLNKGDDKADGNDALAAAQALLAGSQGKGRPKLALGGGKAGDAMGGGGRGGGGGFGDMGGGEGMNYSGGGGGGPGAGGKIAGGGGGGGGKDFDGDPFKFSEDQGGGGGGGGGFNFTKPVEFGTASASGSGPTEPETTVDGGNEELAEALRKKPTSSNQVLVLAPSGGDKKRGWLLDAVGFWRKNVCEMPEAMRKVALCEALETKRRTREMMRKRFGAVTAAGAAATGSAK